MSGDIEQTFHIAHKAQGGGPLTIDIPISGLTAVTSGSSIDLRDSAERIVTTYSGLGVTDAKGKWVPASMAASSDGSAIEITVQDAHARYPLTIDPTWSNPLLDLYVGKDNGGIEPVNPTTGAVGTDESPPLTTSCGFCQMIILPGDTTGYVLSWGGISGGENAATPINLATGVFGTPVQVPGEADSITAAPNGQTVYVVSFNFGYSYLTAINTATNTEEYSDHIYPNISASAISPDGATLWLSGNGSYVFPLNLATGTQGAEITVPAYPTSLVMSPNGQTLFAVEGDGILPINLTTDAVGSLISVGIYGGPQLFAVAPNGQTGYVVGDGNTVTPVNLVTDTVGTPISLAGLPNNEGTQLVAMTVAPNGQMGYVLSQEGDVIPLNLATGAPGSPILGVSSGGYSLVQAPPASNVAPEATATEDASVHSPGCQHNITPRDPVDCASGDFFHTFTDDSVPGYGPALDLTRTYNSLNATTEGIFGYGWTSSYDSHLVVNGDGSITITEGDGSQVTATPNGSGGFTVPSWADSTLTSSGGSYTFVRHQQQTFTFNSSGQLTSIVDPNGATTSLAYTSGKLYTANRPVGSRPHLRLWDQRSRLIGDRPDEPTDHLRLRCLRQPDERDGSLEPGYLLRLWDRCLGAPHAHDDDAERTDRWSRRGRPLREYLRLGRPGSHPDRSDGPGNDVWLFWRQLLGLRRNDDDHRPGRQRRDTGLRRRPTAERDKGLVDLELRLRSEHLWRDVDRGSERQRHGQRLRHDGNLVLQTNALGTPRPTPTTASTSRPVPRGHLPRTPARRSLRRLR